MTSLFVDESKTRGYTMVATVVAHKDLDSLRRSLRKNRLRGQKRIHFTKERDSRKRLLLSRFTDLRLQSVVFHCDTKDDVAGRRACLSAIVAHAASHGYDQVVIERDASIEQADKKAIQQEVQRQNARGTLTYRFEAPQLEPLLWVADAVAWSYTKGGDWMRRAKPLISGVENLDP